jgi:trans-2,3-dihydro-3-hydroxyanthranilate isomerase
VAGVLLPGATLSYDVVDVFTNRAFSGNPLAVVHGADALEDWQLQAIAAEFALSETAFPLPSTEADYRLRIFTPAAELPFAGQPSIGAAWVLGEAGVLPLGPVVQETAAGLHGVVIGPDVVVLAGDRPTVGARLDPGPLATALGLEESDVDTSVAAGVAGAGADYTFLPVHPDAVARATPDPAWIAAHAIGRGLVPVSFDGRVAHVRMFRATGYEDAATGAAALALGPWLVDRGLLPDGGDYDVHQGAEVGRPSTLVCVVTATGGRAQEVGVGGQVVPVATGTIRVPRR